MTIWHPISEAPTSGVFETFDLEEFERGPFLLVTDGEHITIGCFEGGRWHVTEGGLFEPSHWAALPDLPTSQPQEASA